MMGECSANRMPATPKRSRRTRSSTKISEDETNGDQLQITEVSANDSTLLVTQHERILNKAVENKKKRGRSPPPNREQKFWFRRLK